MIYAHKYCYNGVCEQLNKNSFSTLNKRVLNTWNFDQYWLLYILQGWLRVISNDQPNLDEDAERGF